QRLHIAAKDEPLTIENYTNTIQAAKQENRDRGLNRAAARPGERDVCAPMALQASEASFDPDRADECGPRQAETPDLVSIVILTFNELEYTKRCVESIRKHTPEPHEILFVDNGSTDGTTQWLRKLARENARYRLIENKTNLGFAKGCNQGIEAASGEYVLLLNNDTVVTKDWLSGMLETLKSAPDIGIVGPMTNCISGIQKVKKIGYSAIGGLERYARTFREKNRHRRTEARRLVGFCMLFKRSLVEAIGPLDESFGTGNFEDDDFCARAAMAGHRNVIAGDVFIHHFGSRSFIGNRIDYGSAMTGNRKIYADKWRSREQRAEEGRKIRALVAREQAGDRFQRGDIQGAVDLYFAAIRNCPDDRRAYHDLANCLIQVKRYPDALDVLNATPAGGAGIEGLILEGHCREGLNDLEAAESLAARALSQCGSTAALLNLKGVLAHRRGNAAEAKDCLREAIQKDPSNGEFYTNLGLLTWADGEREAALDLLERGFILTPHVEDIASRYHEAAISLGAIARAEAVFGEARSLYPASRTIAFLRISLLMAQENCLSAMEEIESAMTAFDVDDGFIAAALEVRGRIGPMEIHKKDGGETISLCMIVKNEQPNLVRCLSSVKTAVDEMIVVDTGSTDRTREIASVFGAKVFDTPWNGDFAEARNTALSKATGSWIFVLDGDEAVSTADSLKLRDLVKHAGKRKDAAGWLVTTRTYSTDMNLEGWTANDGTHGSEEAASGWFPSVKVRLFRNDPSIRYEGAVHEMVEPSMKRAGLTWLPCDLVIHHYGYSTGGDGGPSKGESYYRLGKKKIEQTGGDPRSVYELAVQASRLKKFGEAVTLWHRYLSSGCGEDRHLAFLNLGHALIETGRYPEALDASRRALAIDAGLKEAGLNAALCEFYSGRYGEAASRLEDLVARPEHYPPADTLLSAACLLSGENARSAILIEALRKRGINAAPFYQVYGKKLRDAGRTDDAGKIAEVARRIWAETLAGWGIGATKEAIDALMTAADPD
ncbi:MAG TPA: glycosyltransferase, partial [Syntrophales bacterium]|nr:glycosyltransferase [Syntrophales bacterium]